MARPMAASAVRTGRRETPQPVRWTASATQRQAVVEPGQPARRRAALVVLAGGVSLIPWTVGLAVTLPRRYLVGTWTITWIGFDVVLIGCFSVTAWALWKQRQVAVPATMVTSVLLLCDAWFDVLTAHRGGDLLISTMTALFVEIPIAIGLAAMSTRLLRAGMRMPASTADPAPTRSLWRAPLCQHGGMGR
jgi:putative effector of murein hydrolase LrgA (UPF0299 family)